MNKRSGMPGRARHDGVLVLALSFLAACSSPEPIVIDGSSPEAFAATAAKAREQLTAADRLAFDQALASVPARRHAADPEQLRRTTFDGMTGAEIVEDWRRRQ